MRYFALENSKGAELDITTQEILFHGIGGLGFEEETSFRRIGEVFWLDSVNNAQTPITGKVIFTENGDTTPYQKYQLFSNFIKQTPLIIKYYPHGRDSACYRKNARVTTLGKTEYNEYGVLDCDIEFTPYTPWYEVVTYTNGARPDDPELMSTGWIWGDSDTESTEPLAFSTFSNNNEDDPDATSECYVLDDDNVTHIPATRPRFRWEPIPRIELPNIVSNSRNPIKLTIHGPCVDPSWFLYNNDEIYATGGFEDSFTLNANQWIVIDNTTGQYSMKLYTEYEANPTDIYQLRDFDKACFLSMVEGKNAVVVTNQSGNPVSFEVEGHIYHATV